MTSEFHVALAWTVLSFPNTLCVVWRALFLLYWLVATIRGLWEDCGRTFGLVLPLVGLSTLTEVPIAYFTSNRAAVVTAKVLNQGLLCVSLFLVHNMREKRATQMSLRHRVCYALLVENSAAFSLSWNYVQTATLAGALLGQGSAGALLGQGSGVEPTLDLAPLFICVVLTASAEVVFLNKFRWTVAAHAPIQFWACTLYRQSVLHGATVFTLAVLNVLLLVFKTVAREIGEYLIFCPKKSQDENVDQKPLQLEV